MLDKMLDWPVPLATTETTRRASPLVRGGGPGGTRTRDQAIMSHIPTVELDPNSALTWCYVGTAVRLVPSSGPW